MKLNLKKIYPSLFIALPLLGVAAFSSANGGFFANVANAGYGGQDSNCPDLSTMTLTPSTETVTPGQHVDFNGRNFAHEEDVLVYLNGTQVGTAHADGGGNFTTGSITTPTTPDTYTYSFVGVACNTPITSSITVSPSTSSPQQGSGQAGSSTGSSQSYSNITINPSSQTAPVGSSIDFGGSNFAHEEDVSVTLNGVVIAHAHADGGGNFTTGSITLPSTPGTYTYTFTGVTSNTPVTSTITVQ